MKDYLTKEDWGDWKDHIVTKKFFDLVREAREYGITQLASGMYSEDLGKTHLCIGKINALSSILEAEFIEANNG